MDNVVGNGIVVVVVMRCEADRKRVVMLRAVRW